MSGRKKGSQSSWRSSPDKLERIKNSASRESGNIRYLVLPSSGFKLKQVSFDTKYIRYCAKKGV